MDKKPILTFQPAKILSRNKGKSGFDPNSKLPEPRSLEEQNTFVTEKIESIEEYFARQTSVLGETPEGMIPEKILVIEAKSFDMNLRRKFVEVLGVEWLLDAEIKDEELEDDDSSTSYWYLTMTNQAALAKLKTAWGRYYKNDRNYGYGYSVLNKLFDRIDDIRFWGSQDRLRNTGLLERFKFCVENQQISIPVEVELWNRCDDELNKNAAIRIKEKVIASGGSVLSTCHISEISYNTVLALLPVALVKDFFDQNKTDIELLAADEVMYFRPTSQCFVSTELEEIDQASVTLGEDFIRDEPIVAILDGFPLSKHEALDGKIIIDDANEFEENCEARWRVHGTSMASCIINGDASDEGQYRIGPVYLRPIMVPSMDANRQGQHIEGIPENYLPVDLIHSAVIKIFEGDGNEPAAAPSVKIINLSIGDRRHLYDSRVSPLARLIDWLSWKYDVMFVISAGNYPEDIELNITHGDFISRSIDEQRRLIISAIKREGASKRLLSPAESINSLTVGALHDDSSQEDLPESLLDPFERGKVPSPINTASWGLNKAIKPDVLMPGGRQVYRSLAHTDSMNEVLSPNMFPSVPAGIKTALPSSNQTMNNYGYTTGSSNAAALATRKAAMVFEALEDLASLGGGLGPMQYSVALRALLVHSADISSLDLKHFWDGNSRTDKYHITRYSGYGKLDPDLSHSCFENQATLIINGLIKPEEGHRYEFPLPECLDGSQYERRVIMTLAWKSPIRVDSHRYRGIKLFFDAPTHDKPGDLQLRNPKELHHQQVRKGTVQHEVLSGDTGMMFDNDSLPIIVNAMTDAIEDKEMEIPYTLVVTLETPKDVLPIYEQVKTQLDIRERARTEAIRQRT